MSLVSLASNLVPFCGYLFLRFATRHDANGKSEPKQILPKMVVKNGDLLFFVVKSNKNHLKSNKSKSSLVGGFNPIEEYACQNGFIFPKVRGEHEKYWKPPPRSLLFVKFQRGKVPSWFPFVRSFSFKPFDETPYVWGWSSSPEFGISCWSYWNHAPLMGTPHLLNQKFHNLQKIDIWHKNYIYRSDLTPNPGCNRGLNKVLVIGIPKPRNASVILVVTGMLSAG